MKRKQVLLAQGPEDDVGVAGGTPLKCRAGFARELHQQVPVVTNAICGSRTDAQNSSTPAASLLRAAVGLSPSRSPAAADLATKLLRVVLRLALRFGCKRSLDMREVFLSLHQRSVSPSSCMAGHAPSGGPWKGGQALEPIDAKALRSRG